MIRFAPLNCRFHPVVTYKERAGDIARAIRWLHDHARDHGGDPSRVILMWHSAAAHLAALLGTDGRYLKNEGAQAQRPVWRHPFGRGGL
jgi:arylformamidase